MNKLTLPVTLGILLIASGVFYVVQYNDAKITKEKLDKEAYSKLEHSLTVYAKTSASESQILAFKNLLENQSSVQSVKYISAEQALADFKAKHQDDKLVLQALDEQGASASLSGVLEITISDLTQRESLINFIKTNDQNVIVDRILSRP